MHLIIECSCLVFRLVELFGGIPNPNFNSFIDSSICLLVSSYIFNVFTEKLKKVYTIHFDTGESLLETEGAVGFCTGPAIALYYVSVNTEYI